MITFLRALIALPPALPAAALPTPPAPPAPVIYPLLTIVTVSAALKEAGIDIAYVTVEVLPTADVAATVTVTSVNPAT
jgi:hypothetical protein